MPRPANYRQLTLALPPDGTPIKAFSSITSFKLVKVQISKGIGSYSASFVDPRAVSFSVDGNSFYKLDDDFLLQSSTPFDVYLSNTGSIGGRLSVIAGITTGAMVLSSSASEIQSVTNQKRPLQCVGWTLDFVVPASTAQGVSALRSETCDIFVKGVKLIYKPVTSDLSVIRFRANNLNKATGTNCEIHTITNGVPGNFSGGGASAKMVSGVPIGNYGAGDQWFFPVLSGTSSGAGASPYNSMMDGYCDFTLNNTTNGICVKVNTDFIVEIQAAGASPVGAALAIVWEEDGVSA